MELFLISEKLKYELAQDGLTRADVVVFLVRNPVRRIEFLNAQAWFEKKDFRWSLSYVMRRKNF